MEPRKEGVGVTILIKGDLHKSRNKFSVAPKDERTIDGILFASKREATRYAELILMVKAGIICELETQPRFDVLINGIKVITYHADFRYRDPKTGAYTVEDTKSSGTKKDEAFAIRKRCVEAYYGNKITIVVK